MSNNDIYKIKYNKYKKKYLCLKKKLGGINRTPLKLGPNSEIKYMKINDNITIKTVQYTSGYYFYNASRNNDLDWGNDLEPKSLWFGLKEEDVINYGNYIYILEVVDKIIILDLEDTNTYNFINSLLNDINIKDNLRESWGDGTRKTSRESDYPVINYLSKIDFLYNIYNIDGIGTGRGLPYIDAPKGHHAEVCIFYRSRNKINIVEMKKINNFNIGEKAVALNMKNKRRDDIRRKKEERRKFLDNLRLKKKVDKKRSFLNLLNDEDNESDQNSFKMSRHEIDNISNDYDIDDIL